MEAKRRNEKGLVRGNRMKTSLKLLIGLFTMLYFLQGCAHIHQKLTPSEEEKARYGTTGIVNAGYAPDLKFDTFAVGASAGAWKGAGEGALKTASSLCQGGGHEAGVLLCALGIVLSPVGAVVGSAYGAKKAVSEEKSRDIEGTLRKAVADLKVQETMAARIIKNCIQLTDSRFRYLSGEGPRAFDDRPDYRSQHGKGIHTILEVRVNDLGFVGGEGKDPLISFFMDVRARLIRTEDNEEIFSFVQPAGQEKHSYVSVPRNIAEWARDDARPLNEELEKCYEILAEKIVETAFVELAPPEKSTMEKLSSWPDRYRVESLSPKATWSFMSNKRIFPKVESLRPTLTWKAFPTDSQREKETANRLDKISDITYDLRIWKVEKDFPAEPVYFRQDLTGSSHQLEKSLEPSTRYYWSVQARFKLDGRLRRTAGTYPVGPGRYYNGFDTLP
jgi:hypothetical protein